MESIDSEVEEFLSLKMQLDSDDNEELEDLTIYDVDKADQAKLGKAFRKIHSYIEGVSDELTDYMSESDRDSYWEIYLSTSGHGAGYFDHGTDMGDKIQDILDKKFKYAFEQLYLYVGDDGVVYIEGIPEL